MVPKVSVIIPLYNSEAFIADTLDSVLKQTYADIEIVAVDDGSSDDTPGIVSSKDDGRIVYLKQKNMGISAARNSGISAAKGEYIAFIDHDDKWLPDKLDRQMALFRRDEDLALAYCDGFIRTNGRISNATLFSITHPRRGHVYYDLLRKNFIPIISVVLKKKILDDIGMFDTGFSIAEDWDLLLRVAKRYRMDYIDEPLVEYSIHPKNFSKDRMLMLRETVAVLDKNLGQADTNTAGRVKRSRAFYEFVLGAAFLKRDEAGAARDCFKKSIEDDPFGIRPYLGYAFALLPGSLLKTMTGLFTQKSMHE